MLEDSLFESQDRKKTRKPLTVAIAAVAHAVTIGVLVLIPLLQMQALPLPPVNLSLLAPRVDVPIITTAFSGQPRVQKSPIPLPDTLTAPESIPRDVIKVVDDFVPPIVGLMPSGGGSRGPVLTDLLNPRVGELAPVDAPPPPPLPPPPPVVKAAPYRLGGNVQAGNLIHQVNPAYPQLARQARVQGVVVLEAVINKEGAVESLRVVSGHPLLTQAALDAVKQWRYRPTLLNGEPVDVITTVTVTFTFQ